MPDINPKENYDDIPKLKNTKDIPYEEYFPEAFKYLDRLYGSKQDEKATEHKNLMNAVINAFLDMKPDPNKPSVDLKSIQWMDAKSIEKEDPLEKIDRKSLSKYLRGEYKKE